MRTAAVRAIGGWDAWNIAEDADLGLRLVRAGYRLGDPPSRAREEAPLTIAARPKQRSRWIKGYMQTLVTHLRQPVELLREAGPTAALTFVALSPGTVGTALGYPIFVDAVVIAYGHDAFRLPVGHFGTVLAALAISVSLFGPLAILALPALGALRRRAPHLLPHVPLPPPYHALVSLTAWLDLYDTPNEMMQRAVIELSHAMT